MQNSAGAMPTAPQNGVSSTQRKPGSVNKSLFIVVTGLAFFTLAGLFLTAVLSGAVMISLHAENRRLDEQAKSLASRVDDLEKENRQLWIAADMFIDCYTSDFYTNSILFCDDNVVVLDICPQGLLEDDYTGKGKFNVSDTVLKGAIQEYVTLFRDMYQKAKLPGMTEFSGLKFRIETYGYDLATYENGAVTLAKDD